MLGPMNRNEITEQIVVARLARGLKWQELADAVDRPVMWTTSALLGQHPIPPELGRVLVGMLGLDQSAVPVLAAPPMRGGLPTFSTGPHRPHHLPLLRSASGLRPRHQRTHPRAVRRRDHERDELQPRPAKEITPVRRSCRAHTRREITFPTNGFRSTASSDAVSPSPRGPPRPRLSVITGTMTSREVVMAPNGP